MGAKKRNALFSPECTLRVACDGAVLSPKRVAKGITICKRCELTKKNRGKVIPPRGENVDD